MELDRIYNEDCLEGMKRIADGAVDCVCTDIPYNEVNRTDNGLRNLDKKSADIGLFDVAELTRTLCAKSKGSVYMFCGINQVSDIRRTMSECNLSTRLLIWEKTNPSPMNGDKIWLSGIECCMYGKKSGAVFNEFCKNTVFRYPSGDSNLHPTQKPLTLIRRLVLASTEMGGGSSRPLHWQRHDGCGGSDGETALYRLRDQQGILRHRARSHRPSAAKSYALLIR